jgi:hypothetical protein
MKKAYHGQQFGCNDTGAPETYTAEQLSRVRDMLFAAEKVEPIAEMQDKLVSSIFKMLPEAMKLELNYSNWKYVEEVGEDS